MELTRRDALAALAGAGIVGGGAAAALARDRDGSDTADESVLEVLVASAVVLYPSDLDGVEGFVRTYSVGRMEAREAYRTGVAEAVATLDEHARAWTDTPYRDLDPSGRDELLRSMGVDQADPDPAGTAAERVRFYVVNELLYALYTSPTGGELVGIENPPGHPGGTESYRRGPAEGG